MDLDAGDPAALRSRLTDELVAAGRIRTEPVERAFRAVPRHAFLPGTALDVVYADEAVPTKWAADGRPISSSSQPAVMAMMLEQLGVAPGQRVLEIGAGTGYNAALIAHLVGPTGQVVTVDVDADVADQARENLTTAGVSGVTVVCADGAAGFAPAGPYDRIIVTAGAWDLAPAWWEQLAAGGRLVVPLSLRGGIQRSVAFDADGDGWEAVSIVDCGFMPLRGALAEPGGPRLLGDEPGLLIGVDDDRVLDTAALYAALTRPGELVPTGVRVGRGDLWGGLALWLALHEPDLALLSAIGPAVELGLVPALLAFRSQTMTMGLVGTAELAMLTRLAPSTPDPDLSTLGTSTSDPASPDPSTSEPASLDPSTSGSASPDPSTSDLSGADPSTPDPESSTPESSTPDAELAVRGFGASGRGDELANRLAAQVRAWDARGRPATNQLRLRAYPAGSHPDHTGTVIDKRHTRLELHWLES
jgi:protein-L-isoaspartate(D-aspartate) O-methyltransferase